ncbi:hypothetical protein [Nocardia grenadensis]|uniref:hypothetical protein n=1 Tax=Nocardia grenadensis TaxID=931537 RepID=UPI0007A51F1C|nr:hypothetical protein [Nocardia grenadensis]
MVNSVWPTGSCNPAWSPAFVTNAERAMVVLPDGAGDPGEHAVGPRVAGRSEGFLLANVRYDEYPGSDTVPIADVVEVVRHIVAAGSWPVGARWVADR